MSSPRDGHLTVTPEIQAAALGCFATHIALFSSEKALNDSLEAIQEIDARFYPVVQAYLSDAMAQIEAAAEIAEKEELDEPQAP